MNTQETTQKPQAIEKTQTRKWSVRWGTPDKNPRVEANQINLPVFMQTCMMTLLWTPTGVFRIISFHREGKKIFITVCHPDESNMRNLKEMELVGIPIFDAIQGMFDHKVLQSAVGWTDSHSRAVREKDEDALEQYWHPNITEHILCTYGVSGVLL